MNPNVIFLLIIGAQNIFDARLGLFYRYWCDTGQNELKVMSPGPGQTCYWKKQLGLRLADG